LVAVSEEVATGDHSVTRQTSWAPPLLSLGRREAHIWCVFPDALTDLVLLNAYRDLMCSQERDRQQRCHFEKGQREYLITRALVRTTLSRYVKIDPCSWRFQKNAYGKPEIVYPRNILPLRFNLSHTDGLIACLVVLDREAGVDVEDTERAGMTVEIANQFFSPSEAQALSALPVNAQRQRFFEYWTLKESYIKARGMGVSLPFERFSFHLEEGQPARISFDSRLEDDPSNWQFAQLRPTQRHLMAVALRRGAESDLDIQMKQTVPLLL
jgi:4'-phosphopantetheinyl transferase